MPVSCITGDGKYRGRKPCNILPRQQETRGFTATQPGDRVGNDFSALEERILETENTYLYIYLSVYVGVNPTNKGGRM